MPPLSLITTTTSTIDTINRYHHPKKHNSKRAQVAIRNSKADDEKEVRNKKEMDGGNWIVGNFSRIGRKVKSKVEKVRENLSPKQKGDWKDVVLMGLSFAVYIYISQKIVLAYCSWIAIHNHHP